MSNAISQAEIEHLGRLARLDLSPDQIERYSTELSSIVGYVDQLQAVAATAESDGMGVTGLVNVLYADQPREANSLAQLDPKQALQAAPLLSGNLIEVRAVLNSLES